jgi:hypothetical protein
MKERDKGEGAYIADLPLILGGGGGEQASASRGLRKGPVSQSD